jgi:hypothetical protein
MLDMMMRDLSRVIDNRGETALAARHLSATGRLAGHRNTRGRAVCVRVDDAKWCAWPVNVAA